MASTEKLLPIAKTLSTFWAGKETTQTKNNLIRSFVFGRLFAKMIAVLPYLYLLAWKTLYCIDTGIFM